MMMITGEEGKAVQEVAKATGKAIDAGREMGGFIAKYLGAPLDQAMGIWTDKLKSQMGESDPSYGQSQNLPSCARH